MLVNPDKERNKLLAWLFASFAKTHAKSELFAD